MDITIAGVIWWHLPLAIVAAAVLVNGVPHLVQGLSGNKFPTPFSGGAGTLDGPVRNVLWGAFNFLVGALLLWAIAGSLGSPLIWVLMALAALGFGVLVAYAFSHPPAVPRGSRNKP